MEGEATRVMIAVNESSMKGYPHPSISSKGAFEWTLHKLVRSNTSGFRLLFLHVQVPDEDGFTDMDSIYASPNDFKNLRNRDKIRGLHLLEYFVDKCHEIGVACEAWIRKGDAKDVICHEVIRVKPDLLILGCRGLGPFQRYGYPVASGVCSIELFELGTSDKKWLKSITLMSSWASDDTRISDLRVFVGTVSEFCQKHAECPVLTIKRSPDEVPQDPVDD